MTSVVVTLYSHYIIVIVCSVHCNNEAQYNIVHGPKSFST